MNMDKPILHIDTASETGLVMISQSGMPVVRRYNEKATEHAAFVQPAIGDLLKETGISPKDIGCIAVANGPGSYTGLRVGLASAKGLCFSWNIPLLTLSSLRIMAAALQESLLKKGEIINSNSLFAPLIDARRMEVFRAVYNHPMLDTITEPGAEILTEAFLASLLEKHPVFFSGSGAAKWQNTCKHSHAFFLEQPPVDFAFAKLAFHAAVNNEWANLVYSEPFYTKSFHTITKAKH
jgi:tRNA threonylcarbamoyladenosine biosynthesis protein TsaB